MSSTQDPKPDGAAFDDFFDSIGKKAENLTTKDDKPAESTQEEGEEEDQRVVDEIESLCMNCHENGITRLLLTRIPFFREIILMSFFCPHCNFKNSEIQSAGEIQQKGTHHELRLTTQADFGRQVVKSDTCTVKFIELDIEVPPGRGQLTNVEGLLSMILEDLELQQPARKEQVPEVWAKIEEIIKKGRGMLAGEAYPFRVSLDDPAGNSWIEPDQKDGVGKLARTTYARTPEQNEGLGLSGDAQPDTTTDGDEESSIHNPEGDDIVPNEVYSFPATCPGCSRHCVTHMKMVDIPHFKQVVIMSTVCDHCGYRSNEVKTGGEVPEKGTQITLQVDSPVDLARDILKSESCALECPELELSVNPGTLGGRFTTVEGLLTQVRDDLRAQIFDIDGGGDAPEGGDGMESEAKTNWNKFFAGIDAAIKGEKKFSVVLKDPLGSSYVQDLYKPEKDPRVQIVEYDRTAEEEEELGLTDMKVENYAEDEVTEGGKEEK
ncbi:putative zinc finger protein zpr1 protein [Coleophoma crateriformis]|uniref:Putative zinc finger protein zpr1 protein n=1 Tax=Coleophoma crateriformis TaxID=565419 RepID=A0A3D8RDG6_9HELO|nr:putative zinc finger protein zpr1 protein [Coleophoma crateriformis]